MSNDEMILDLVERERFAEEHSSEDDSFGEDYHQEYSEDYETMLLDPEESYEAINDFLSFDEFEDNSRGLLSSGSFKDKEMIIAEIERLMEQQVDVLLDPLAGPMILSLKTRTNKPETGHDLTSQTVFATRLYRFPGSSQMEAWRFTVIFRLLILIHEALVCDSIITKRELFYRDPNLFKSQRTVDRYIDDLARTFNVSRAKLNITATAKGLAVGCFTLERSNGTSVNGRDHPEGYLISSMETVQRMSLAGIAWILVVEKEATFRLLIQSAFWTWAKSKGIIITAKGYPDLLTREFLNLASIPSERNYHHYCPVYGLFDYDPDGISILHTYKYGSAKSAHEPSGIGCTYMEWMGLKDSDVFSTNYQSQHGLFPLTARDRRRASRMLAWPVFGENSDASEIRREIQRMMFVNKKAEIQLLEAFPGGLSARLTRLLVTTTV